MSKRIQASIFLSLISLVLFFGLFATTATPAAASLRQIEEAPGQILYQSRQTLPDKSGNAWQVVFFKQTKTGQPSTINLRLVGFPGASEFVHPKDLTIKIRPGITLIAADVFFEKSPAPNVGQYDFSNLVKQWQENNFWELELPLQRKDKIELLIPYFVIQEWQSVAAS
jgi:hypothetical protein